MKTTMTILTTLLMSGLFAQAKAQSIETSEILSALIAESSVTEVVDSEGQALEKSLSSLLGEMLASRVNLEANTMSRIVSVNGECEATDAGHGMAYYDCKLTIGDGDYKKTKKGFKGPLLESGVTLTFKVKRNIPKSEEEKSVIQLDSKVVAFFAG